MSDSWLSQALAASQPLQHAPFENMLISKLVDSVDTQSHAICDRPIALAAAFDLLVAAEYYRAVASTHWLYCPRSEPLLFYTYTNTCPRCVLDGDFVFHKAHKPQSGSIGAATSRLLLLFFQELLQRNKVAIEIRRGSEPIDAIFIYRTTTPITVFCAEIKASPLATLPLAVSASPEMSHLISLSEHQNTDVSALSGVPINVYVPEATSESNHSIGHLYRLDSKHGKADRTWAYQRLLELLDHATFFSQYLLFWHQAFSSYQQRQSHPTYWFTNGCGQPTPRPASWPRRAGTGYESVSDSKTSVGMDRTDDIKKATYQVLKLGAAGKPTIHYHYKTGIVSNIHAVRHTEGYLTDLQDMMWTREETGRVGQVGQLPADTPLFNLFDGIVTLTATVARDDWIERVFRFT